MIFKNIFNITLLSFVVLVIGNTGLCSENSSGLELSKSTQKTISHSCAEPIKDDVMMHKKTGHHLNGCNSSKICCNDDLPYSKNALPPSLLTVEPVSIANSTSRYVYKPLTRQDINNPPQFNLPQTRSIFLFHCTFLI